jgi:hypothetical protein
MCSMRTVVGNGIALEQGDIAVDQRGQLSKRELCLELRGCRAGFDLCQLESGAGELGRDERRVGPKENAMDARVSL